MYLSPQEWLALVVVLLVLFGAGLVVRVRRGVPRRVPLARRAGRALGRASVGRHHRSPSGGRSTGRG